MNELEQGQGEMNERSHAARRTSATRPILGLQSRNLRHALAVGRNERRVRLQRVGRDRGVEVLDAPEIAHLERRFDRAEAPADGVSPLRAYEFGTHELESFQQSLPVSGTRQ